MDLTYKNSKGLVFVNVDVTDGDEYGTYDQRLRILLRVHFSYDVATVTISNDDAIEFLKEHDHAIWNINKKLLMKYGISDDLATKIMDIIKTKSVENILDGCWRAEGISEWMIKLIEKSEKATDI